MMSILQKVKEKMREGVFDKKEEVATQEQDGEVSCDYDEELEPLNKAAVKRLQKQNSR